MVGTEGAHLLRLGPTGLTRIDAFETMPGRDDWYTPWGGPPEVRSLACTADNVLLANMHVGGIARSDDSGRTWSPTMDIQFDVHQVRSIWGRGDLVVAAAGVGFCVRRRRRHVARHRRGAATTPTAARSPSPTRRSSSARRRARAGRQAAIYRTWIHGDTPFERVTDWIDGQHRHRRARRLRRPGRLRHRVGRGVAVLGRGRDVGRSHHGLAPVTSLSLLP